ncbi:ABC transporter permease [Candidatus Methylacidiphilum fumarolicum]|uniref:ABC-type dipeptide/oligopeptide/nickel transport system, permease component n=2 Tax=Candidatus Methylacidiphilum fumarolicum TaxID=591154 RepID=I0JYD4_METFB|nr:ABC transporter permease [Candidatus Methylacidiphilum fumarolicum]MBW6414796.1 ABC transporter permease [Candidatus Methylacidiphilum fumarolicum]TFE67363.1 ABC transporter permease [Candidatus Methylacidiphilum fumarolicum]TFE73343.1 ABC transporter permease [Candidatus Methylacidiphilum fumarolicum]TFE74124.1 ABC transporter permease [Candidatus Methylacidiphilum fumarolicum]TFE77028.1 ABC transporter permease [Candidatus Methylacidiphilum fumarolicum]
MNEKRSYIKELLRNPFGLSACLILLFLYLIAILAPFLAPYEPSDQDLKKTYHPPTKIYWHSARFVVARYKNVDPSSAMYKVIEGDYCPLKWFVHGYAYRLLGIFPSDIHLFGVDKPDRVYLLGSDNTGRDVFSRLVYGSQVSLSIGLIGVSITMILGLLIGGLSGYYGGWFDNVVMRLTEFLMAVPALYLLLALRGIFGVKFSSAQVYFLIVIILSFIGWSGFARVIRGLVLSLRSQTFVDAAIVLGQSSVKILLKHLLPNLASYLLVSAALSIPGYILGEAALSFLGLGIQEPSASWGLMLAQAQDMKVFMLNFWWLLTPGIAILITVVAFNMLGDVLRDLVDPKFRIYQTKRG